MCKERNNSSILSRTFSSFSFLPFHISFLLFSPQFCLLILTSSFSESFLPLFHFLQFSPTLRLFSYPFLFLQSSASSLPFSLFFFDFFFFFLSFSFFSFSFSHLFFFFISIFLFTFFFFLFKVTQMFILPFRFYLFLCAHFFPLYFSFSFSFSTFPTSLLSLFLHSPSLISFLLLSFSLRFSHHSTF